MCRSRKETSCTGSKGFLKIAALSENDATTRMHAVQSVVYPIVEAFRKKLKGIPVHPSPDTVALSMAERRAPPSRWMLSHSPTARRLR